MDVFVAQRATLCCEQGDNITQSLAPDDGHMVA